MCVCVSVCTGLYLLVGDKLKPEYTQTHGDSCHGGDLD